MPWAPITLTPGLNVELTGTDNRAGYTATNLGRFKAGRFQKLGGWEKFIQSALDGYPRATHAWEDLAQNNRLVVGTTTHLFDVTSGAISDVTPQTKTTNPTISFTTSAGSPIITVADSGVTAITGYDAVYFNTPISVDTIILHGLYQVTGYVASGQYTITAATNAAAGVSAGGAVPTFTATAGSPNITVTFADHGLLAGDDIVFPIATTVSDISIVGRYIVQSVTSSSQFVITAQNSAATTPGAPVAMNSNKAQLVYHIAVGPVASGGAYGVGTYGDGYYGTGSPVTPQLGTAIASTDWSLSNWGELLIASPENGGVYYWGPNSGFQNASIIATGPAFCTGSFIANAQQMIITYGTTVNAGIGVYQDPLMVKWCDSEDFFTWTASSANQAGGYRIPKGSRCVGGASTPHRSLIWTDVSVWALDYIGASLVYGFTEMASGCGLIAKHAHAESGDIVYWMTKSGFFSLNGGVVSPIECPVWDAVFQDLDLTNAARCHAGLNSDFNEVWFYYPSESGGLGYCDRYAKLNTITGLWDIGALQRNTWLDRSVIGNPVSMSNTGFIYKHEYGYDADGSPLNSWFETGWIIVGEGEDLVFVDRIFPDLKWGEYNGSENAEILITVYAVHYPGDTVRTYGPFTVNKAKKFLSKRIRDRQIKLRVESNDLGSFWRLGHFRMRWAPDGKAP